MTYTFQDKATIEWGIRAFGAAHISDPRMRAIRFFEETVELVQALGLSKEHLQKVMDVVYSREVGNARSEIGGVMVTLRVLAHAGLHIDPDAAYEAEILRVLAKPVEHFTARNEEKIKLGLKP